MNFLRFFKAPTNILGELKTKCILLKEVSLRSCKHACKRNALRVGAGAYIPSRTCSPFLLSSSASFLFRSFRRNCRLWAAVKGAGRKQEFECRREEKRNRSDLRWKQEKSAMQVALSGGRPQTCFSCYILSPSPSRLSLPPSPPPPHGLYEAPIYGDRGPVPINRVQRAFFPGIPRRIARLFLTTLSVVTSSLRLPHLRTDEIEGFANT
jgi:hypothetical protein